jgi:D-tyrosyl-tRNA(Tyr) deacylase
VLALLQRVSEAWVEVDDRVVGRIGSGLLIFLCVLKGDTEEDLDYLVKKVSNLRIFEDSTGRMNLSLLDMGYEALVISQFTLSARTRKGNRPSFDNAEVPERAKALYEEFIARLGARGIRTESGVFGAMMKVHLINDGPVTIVVDSREKRRS